MRERVSSQRLQPCVKVHHALFQKSAVLSDIVCWCALVARLPRPVEEFENNTRIVASLGAQDEFD
jgi:hypothetical protein